MAGLGLRRSERRTAEGVGIEDEDVSKAKAEASEKVQEQDSSRLGMHFNLNKDEELALDYGREGTILDEMLDKELNRDESKPWIVDFYKLSLTSQ